MIEWVMRSTISDLSDSLDKKIPYICNINKYAYILRKIIKKIEVIYIHGA